MTPLSPKRNENYWTLKLEVSTTLPFMNFPSKQYWHTKNLPPFIFPANSLKHIEYPKGHNPIIITTQYFILGNDITEMTQLDFPWLLKPTFKFHVHCNSDTSGPYLDITQVWTLNAVYYIPPTGPRNQ
jgi:hypothetical protein